MTSRFAQRCFSAFAAACLAAGASTCCGATVDFWLAGAAGDPAAPSIDVLAGSEVDVGVWARPAAGRTLLGFSLNLVAEGAGVTLTDVVVHNPALDGGAGARRFQLVFDAAAGLIVQDDRIDRFSGFSLADSFPDLDDGAGIGPACQDDLCFDGSGEPSWRIATVTFAAGAAGTSSELFLEIGEQGLWQADEDPTDTSAVFGGDGVEHVWSTEQGETDDRDAHHGPPDLVVNVVDALADADFDDDGDVDGRDFLTVQRGFGAAGAHDQGDADADGEVAAADVAVWQSQFGASPPSVAAVPEPASAIVLIVAVCCARVRLRKF